MQGEPAVTVAKQIDTSKPHAARMYDFFLGGKDHFAADRRTAEEGLKRWPTVRSAVRENHAFLGRVVRYLVAEAGIRQFLLDALPPGSYLAASHVTPEHDPGRVGGLARIYRASGVAGQVRTADECADLAFTGLDMVDPGVVLVSVWRPDSSGPRPLPAEVSLYGGLAVRP